MNRRANPTLIGLFILGALILTVIGIGTLAPVVFVGDRVTFISFFDESVHGLEAGAEVKFQGVPVGNVRRIDVRIDREDMSLDVPVRFDINLQRLRAYAGDYVNLDDELVLREHIAAGLRAQLQMESFVTGLLFVNLSYFDDPPPPERTAELAEYPEIPVRPSPLAALETEAGEMMATAHSVFDQLNRTLEDFQVEEIGTAMIGAARSVEQLADAPEIRQAFREVPGATEQLERTLAEVELAATRIGDAVDPFEAQVEEAGAEVALTLQSLRDAIDATHGALDAEAGLGYRLDEALISLTQAAEALRQLALSLERDPSMLIRGRNPDN